MAGTSLAFRPLQLTLQNRMENLKDELIGRAEAQLGRKIRYASMGPSIFGVLDIRDVLILRNDDSVLLNIVRLRLSYSLLELLRGNSLEAFHTMRIDRPVLSLDFEKDADLAGRFLTPGDEETAGRELSPGSAVQEEEAAGAREETAPGIYLPDNFSLRIWNGEWEFADSGRGFKLLGVGLDASIRQRQIAFQGRWNAEVFLDGGGGLFSLGSSEAASAPDFSALMTGRIDGEYSGDRNEGSAAVRIPSCYGNNFRLKPLTVSFFLAQNRLEIRKTHDRSPAAISLVYDLADSSLRGFFEAENFAPGDLLVFTDDWEEYNSFLACGISGDAEFTWEGNGGLEYTVNLSGKEAPAAGIRPANQVPEAAAPASLIVVASGDREHLLVDTLELDSAYGGLTFRGGVRFHFDDNGPPSERMELYPAAPYGLLSLSNFRLRGDRGISGELFIDSRGRNLSVFGESLSSGDVNLSALDASLSQEAEGLTFALSALRFRDMDDYETVRMSAVSLEGSMDYREEGREGNVQVSLRLDSFSVGDILQLLEPLAPLPALPSLARYAAEDLSVTTEIFFNTDYDHLLYNAPRIVAAYEGTSDILASASLSGTDRGFELREGRVSWETGSAELFCSVDYSDFNDISFSFGTVYRDLTYFFEGMILDKQNVSVRGSYGFQVFLSADGSGAYSGYAQGDNIPIPSGERLAALNFLFSLHYLSPASWQARIDRFELSGMTTPASINASLSFTGAANERGMIIPDIEFDDGRGALGGNLTLDWDNSYSYCGFKADISGNNREEHYALEGMYRDGLLDLGLSGNGMRLSRVMAQNVVVDGDFTLSWESVSSFTAEAELKSLVLYRQGGEIHASARVAANNDLFQLRQLSVTYSGLEFSLPYLRVDRRNARADTEAHIRGDLSGLGVDVALSGEALFGSSLSWLDLYRDFGSLDGSLLVNTARYNTIAAEKPFSFDFSCSQERRGIAVKLNGGPRNMLRFSYTPEDRGGNFYAALSAPSPVRGSLTGFAGSESIDAQGTDLYVDMGSLWRFIPPSVDVMAFPGGIVTGAVRVSGQLDEPEFYGDLKATSLQITVPEYLPDPIRVAPTALKLAGTEVSFGPVDAIVGRGGLGKASGWFRFDQWIPNIFSIDVLVPQESPIPYDFDISGLLAHGLVSGRMNMSMEDLIFTMRGEVTAHDTEISLDAEEMAAAAAEVDTEPDTVTIITDMTIRTGKRVEFFWPSAEFPVLQAYADMGTGIQVTSDDSSKRFTLTGDVKLRSGEIFYLERNFYVREGTLFFKENETQFDPRISARADIRDQTENGPVTVSMIIDNAPLMSFTPRFVSSPPLSQIEIYSLLGQNPQGGATAGQRNVAASALLDSLTQFTVVRRLQRQVRDFLGLDMFSLRTQVIQNVVLQAGRNQTEENSGDGANSNSNVDVDRPYRVGNYFDNTTVFIGKYFAAELFGEAMFSLKYDDNKLDWGGMILEPEIGLEMRNPLFDIRLQMIPLHPENWFISDTSISLIWRRSF